MVPLFLGHNNPFPNKPWFLHDCSISLSKTLWEKDKVLVTSNFSFSHCVFYPFGKFCTVFIKFKIVVCNFFHFGIKILKIVIWERDNLAVICSFAFMYSYFGLLLIYPWLQLLLSWVQQSENHSLGIIIFLFKIC